MNLEELKEEINQQIVKILDEGRIPQVVIGSVRAMSEYIEHFYGQPDWSQAVYIPYIPVEEGQEITENEVIRVLRSTDLKYDEIYVI